MSLLDDVLVADRIGTLIDEWVSIQQDFGNKVLWWEALKIRLKQELVSISKVKAQQNRASKDNLVNQLQQLFDAGIENQTHFNKLVILKSQLLELQAAENRKSFLMSKVRDIQEDEQMSPYFFRKVRQAASRKTFKGLKDKNGKVKKGQGEMEGVVHHFYRTLYSVEETDAGIQSQVLALDSTRLSAEDKQNCEGLLTQDELGRALKGMARGRTPGCDGLPMEFYLKFWDRLGTYLTLP